MRQDVLLQRGSSQRDRRVGLGGGQESGAGRRTGEWVWAEDRRVGLSGGQESGSERRTGEWG